MGAPETLTGMRRALGRQLAALRRQAGLTQAALAGQTGFSRSAVSVAEIGRQAYARDFWPPATPLWARAGC